MNDKIKTHLTTAYMMFVFDFADPSQLDQAKILNSLTVPLNELFHTQKASDKAKKLWGRDGFRKVLCLYFNRFQTPQGLNIEALEQSLVDNKKVLLRHLGKDKVTFLGLIVTLMKASEQPSIKRGLLFGGKSA